MGKPVVNVKLWSLYQDQEVKQGRVQPLLREALADTGATYTLIPKDVADALSLQEAGTRRARYADGRTAVRTVVRGLIIEILGRTSECPALIEPNGPRLLIGQLTLEDLDLYVDCQGKRLVPRPESPDMPMAEEY